MCRTGQNGERLSAPATPEMRFKPEEGDDNNNSNNNDDDYDNSNNTCNNNFMMATAFLSVTKYRIYIYPLKLGVKNSDLMTCVIRT